MSWSPCQIATGAANASRPNPQSAANARSSSRQPAIPSLMAPRRLRARSSANSPLISRVGPGDQAAKGGDDLLALDRAERGRLLLEERRQRVGALHGEAELLDVLRSHPGQEVQALDAVGGDAGDRGGRQAAARQQRGAGERVRAAAGEADRHKLAGPERVEHLGHVPTTSATRRPGRGVEPS